MAIVITNKAASTTSITSSSITTSSVAFQNNTSYMVSVISLGSGVLAYASAVSGGGLTWTLTGGGGSSLGADKNMRIWEGFATSGATTGTLSITLSTTPLACMYSIDEITGVDPTTRIVQYNDAANPATTSLSSTLATFANENNVAYGAFGHFVNEVSTKDATATYTALTNNHSATPGSAINLLTEYKTAGTDTGVSASWATSSAGIGVVFEINAAATDGGISIINKDASATSIDTGPITTASIAFANNKSYIVSFYVRAGTPPTISTITGGGLTWARVLTGGSIVKMDVWEGFTTSGASTGALTITLSTTFQGAQYSIDEITGVNHSSRIVQSAASAGANATSQTVTLATFANENDVAYGVFGHNTDEASTVSATATYTALMNVHAVTPGVATSMIAEYKTAGTDTSVSASWATSSNSIGVALELRAGLPTITNYSPTSGPVGTTVTITGAFFTGVTLVKFNGLSTSFIFVDDATITATVPSGATTGAISITATTGTTTSATAFVVTATPPQVFAVVVV